MALSFSFGATATYGDLLHPTESQTQIAKLDSTRVVAVYQDTTTGTLRGRVGTVSGTTITWGPTSEPSPNGGAFLSVVALSSTKVLLGYQEDTVGLFRAVAVAGAISGTSITWGSFVRLNTSFVGNLADGGLAAISSTKAVVNFLNVNGGGLTKVITVSGTDITLGVEVVYDTSNILRLACEAVALDSTHVVLISMVSSTTVLDARVATVSGTYITIGPVTSVTLSSAPGSGMLSVAELDSSHFIVASGNAEAMVGVVSGTSITFGSPLLYESGRHLNPAITKLDSTHAMVTYHRNFNAPTGGRARVLTISGTSIGTDAFTSFTTADFGPAAVGPPNEVFALASTLVVVGYGDSDTDKFASNVGTSPITLDIQSDPSGIAVTVTPNDQSGDGNGTTPFTREFSGDPSVTIAAPAAVGGRTFLEWRNSSGDVVETSRTLTKTPILGDTDTFFKAFYKFVGDAANNHVIAST